MEGPVVHSLDSNQGEVILVLDFNWTASVRNNDRRLTQWTGKRYVYCSFNEKLTKQSHTNTIHSCFVCSLISRVKLQYNACVLPRLPNTALRYSDMRSFLTFFLFQFFKSCKCHLHYHTFLWMVRDTFSRQRNCSRVGKHAVVWSASIIFLSVLRNH